jgi:hypothetical protein
MLARKLLAPSGGAPISYTTLHAGIPDSGQGTSTPDFTSLTASGNKLLAGVGWGGASYRTISSVDFDGDTGLTAPIIYQYTRSAAGNNGAAMLLLDGPCTNATLTINFSSSTNCAATILDLEDWTGDQEETTHDSNSSGSCVCSFANPPSSDADGLFAMVISHRIQGNSVSWSAATGSDTPTELYEAAVNDQEIAFALLLNKGGYNSMTASFSSNGSNIGVAALIR